MAGALALILVTPATSGALAPPSGAGSIPPRHHGKPRCIGANRSVSAEPSAQTRAALLCLINLERTRRHLPALHASLSLEHAAQGWTDTMVARGNFSQGPGNAFATRISATGYDWQAVGENIATGYPTPRSVVGAWIGSTDHCRNILDPVFRDVGVGVNPRPVPGAATGPATWTADFGLLQGQSPASNNQRPMAGCPYRRSPAAAISDSSRSKGNGVSLRYHSASSAA